MLLDELNDSRGSSSLTLDASDVIAVRAVGNTLLALSEAGTLGMFSLPDGKLRSTLLVKSGAPPYDIKRTLVGSVEADRAIAASGHCPALLFRLSDGSEIATLGSTINNEASFSLDGKLVATIDVDNVVGVWKSDDGARLLTHAFSPPATRAMWLGSRELLVRTKSRHLVRLCLEWPT